MSIITISRGSYSHGKEVAEKIAEKLGYDCISREIILEASEHFNIPEIKLMRAIHDSPSILERFTHGKERYVAYIRAALLESVEKGNVIYHGLAGHFFLQGISHALNVRIIADLEDRVKEEMRREGTSKAKATDLIKKDDEERRKWSLHLYGSDPWDMKLYDLVIHLKSITVDQAVNLIIDTVKLPAFQVTAESQKTIHNLALIARVQAALVEEFPTVKAVAREGKILVTVESPLLLEKEVTEKVKRLSRQVTNVEIKVECQYDRMIDSW